MSKSAKIMKILMILNLAVLVGMLLYCYQHIFTEIPGECDECSVGASISYFMGLIFIVGQIILAIIMCCFIPFMKQSKIWMYVVSIVFACGSIFCSFIQFIAFSIKPMFDSHGDFTAESYKLIHAIEFEFQVATIIAVILAVINLALIGSGACAIAATLRDRKIKNIA